MKKLVSILLVLMMCASILPAFADDTPSKTTEDNVKTTEAATVTVGDTEVVIGVNTDETPAEDAVSVILVTEGDEGDDSAQKTLTEMAKAGPNTADYFTGGINAEAEAEPISEEEEKQLAALNEELTEKLDAAETETEEAKDEETGKDVVIETKTASVEFSTDEKSTNIDQTVTMVKDAETGAELSKSTELKVLETNLTDGSTKETTTTITEVDGKIEKTVVAVVETDSGGKQKTTTTTTTDNEKESKTEVVVEDSEGKITTTTTAIDKEAKDLTTTTTENGETKVVKVLAATVTNEDGTEEKVNPIADIANDSTKKLTLHEHFPLKANVQNLDQLDEKAVIPYPITFDAPTFSENDDVVATLSFVTTEDGVETTTFYVVNCSMKGDILSADLPVSILLMMGDNSASMSVYTVDDAN